MRASQSTFITGSKVGSERSERKVSSFIRDLRWPDGHYRIWKGRRFLLSLVAVSLRLLAKTGNVNLTWKRPEEKEGGISSLPLANGFAGFHSPMLGIPDVQLF